MPRLMLKLQSLAVFGHLQVLLSVNCQTISLLCDIVLPPIWMYSRVATGQGKVREIQDQGKVREFCAGSGKFEILRKVREIQENPLKVREI